MWALKPTLEIATNSTAEKLRSLEDFPWGTYWVKLRFGPPYLAGITSASVSDQLRIDVMEAR